MKRAWESSIGAVEILCDDSGAVLGLPARGAQAFNVPKGAATRGGCVERFGNKEEASAAHAGHSNRRADTWARFDFRRADRHKARMPPTSIPELPPAIEPAVLERSPGGRVNLTRNSTLNLLGEGIPMAVSFIAVRILIGRRGDERYGVLVVAWAVMAYLSLVDLGMGRALTQSVPRKVAAGESPTSLVWTGLALILGLGTAGASALAFATPAVVGWLRVPEALMGEARGVSCAGFVVAVAVGDGGIARRPGSAEQVRTSVGREVRDGDSRAGGAADGAAVHHEPGDGGVGGGGGATGGDGAACNGLRMATAGGGRIDFA
jgi:hypothetical protein